MSETQQPEFVWGAKAIGSLIGRNKRITLYLLNTGALPARKDGGRWVASRAALLAHMKTPNNGYQANAA